MEHTIDRDEINAEVLQALNALEAVEYRLQTEITARPLLGKACDMVLEKIQEAKERLRDRCPVLIGANLGYDEQCQCWMCTFSDELDPFDTSDPEED